MLIRSEPPPDVMPRDRTAVNRLRSDWAVVAIGVMAGCMLLLVCVLLPRLWAQQDVALADDAVRTVQFGWLALAGIALPLWADRLMPATVLTLCGGVFVLLAGQIESREAGPAALSFLGVVGLVAASSTIWAAASRAREIRRWIWLSTVFCVVGLPTFRFLRAN